MPDTKIIRAMFDVQPVDQSGGVDFAKINLVEAKLVLRKSRSPEPREVLIKEFQEEFKKRNNAQTILAKIGGAFYSSRNTEIKRRPLIIRQTRSELKVKFVLPKPEAAVRPFRPVIPIIKFKSAPSYDWAVPANDGAVSEVISSPKFYTNKYLIGGILSIAVIGLAGFLNKDSFQAKVARDGNAAVGNLEQAKTDIEKFDFASAAENFTLAYHNFSAASDRINLLGHSLGSFLGAMPGLGKLKSARNLTEAGENIAQAGESLSVAADNLSKTNFVSYLAVSGNPEKPLSDFINSFRDSLVFAQKRFKTASILLGEVDAQVIPEEKRPSFLDFQAQWPALEEFLDGALNYADFLLELVGQSGPKKYLVLFQNNTELRATGGFIGSYGLADFNRGFLRSFEVKDVYETDGQAKTNIIPPKELQHITPVWGMRDANWFVNFPDSAKKVMQIYTENDGGPMVDGVISITPTVISKILEVIGPVEMPDYQTVIHSGNFLSAIQEEVEYGPNRTKPKQILVDFAPKFLEKLGQLDKEKWPGIFKILTESVEQKHILAYFKNRPMEKVALAGGFGGEIKLADKDYLSVIHTNVKGSKTDAYIDNTYRLGSEVNEAGLVEHNLSITRSHRGGKTDFGFYNRTNYDYVRVLVPEGSKLSEISGHFINNFSPLADYADGWGFVADADLVAYENKIVRLRPGVQQFSEGGPPTGEASKTVFGFWLVVEPGKTKTVTLKYETPVRLDDDRYSLLVQKQPGTLQDVFNFSLALPKNRQVIYKSPGLTFHGDSVNFETKLLKDMEIEIKFQ
ncbi:MAG: Uncharacterized protein G01um101444_232 [Parcubacteria group bacterium Gr01-1014_44]|nr:MAG: Uncharacterized protein G01um101444_232 [Parcubacteria group bacterium Gr01-1014_44]